MIDPALQKKYRRQAEMLANRVKKRFKHLRKRFAKERVDVFRLYDWDIPEIRAVVDWYAGHLVIGEYARRQSTPDWLPMMGLAVAEKMDVPLENLHLKIRRAGKQDGKRYERIAATEERMIVSERDMRFFVNLNDYVDTGLFSDHRNTRRMVQEHAAGSDFLNLFCYTGTFTCYAAKGGARTTLSVDRSETAIQWAQDNFTLNEIPEANNTLVQQDTFEFLDQAKQSGRKFTLAVVDPPSYSTTRVTESAFDIAKDQTALLEAVFEVMIPGSVIFFSTNHQNFEFQTENLDISSAEEITDVTIPEDYVSKKKTIHRCWKISR